MRPGELRIRTLAQLELGPIHTEVIAQAVCPDCRDRVDTTLRRLRRDGLAKCVKRATWVLTKQGAKELAEIRSWTQKEGAA